MKVSAALWTRNTSPSRHHMTRTKVKPESSSESNSVRALVFHSIVSGFLILIQLGECESNQSTKGSVCPRTTVLSSPLGKPTTALAERGSHSLSDIALSSAPEVTSSYVTTWVRVGVNRAQALYDIVVSSVFHTLLSCSIEFWTMHSASFS